MGSSKDKWHFLFKPPLRAESEKEYLWIIFDDAKEGFWHIWGIYDPKIYENYLEILGVTEIYVASQPRDLRVIPLIEKEIFPIKRILG